MAGAANHEGHRRVKTGATALVAEIRTEYAMPNIPTAGLRRAGLAGLASLAALAALAVPVAAAPEQGSPQPVSTHAAREAADQSGLPAITPADMVQQYAQARLTGDIAAMEHFRPGYPFWEHVFSIADGSIAYGSAADGRLLAVFPARGDWSRQGVWEDPTMKRLVAGHRLASKLADKRDEVAQLLSGAAGPVIHNPTRGLFVAPNARRYGRFLEEWGRIYERFGVPAEIGLAQGLVESGLNGKIRSEARAIGFCQWLTSNWNAMKRLSPHVIEGYNQTTQAPYCAAYLAILGTKYGSFIPALSEHHAGGTNVGRTISNGQWLGGENVREYYFLGAAFTRDLRTLAPGSFSDVYGTYGPRSFYYAEMVFGNTGRIREMIRTHDQVEIYAMRTTRAIPIAQVTRRTGLSVDEVRRYNPALVKQVPARATLYLPMYVAAFGSNVTFWHRPPSTAYATVLSEFLAIDRRPQDWDSPAFVPVLRGFERRFRATKTEEGTVMATVLSYVSSEILTSGRAEILETFRNDPEIRRLFDRAVRTRAAALEASTQVEP